MRPSRLLWVALALLACRSEGKPPPAKAPGATGAEAARAAAPDDPAAESYPMPALPLARVTLTDAFKGTHVVEAEVAATDVARTRGLMWRTALAPGKGMLFIFPAVQTLTFWMKNTLIPLDMIFISKELTITGIVENAEPKTLSGRSVGIPSLYVLEVPGGWSEKLGLKAGGAVRLEGAAAIPVGP